MAGEVGDIFWDLAPWIVYTPGYDVGCSIYVANPAEEEKEYALMARLSSNETMISEEALPVFGYTWFKVAPGDFVRLHGAFRFDESDVDLTVLLVERETQQVTDSVSTRLVAPTLGTTPAATIMIAIQKMPECPDSCSGNRSAILATTISAANRASKSSWKVEK